MNDTRLQWLPRLLLFEDHPVSAIFLRDAASTLPAQVDIAASIADALAMAKRHPHDLSLTTGRRRLLRIRLAGLPRWWILILRRSRG